MIKIKKLIFALLIGIGGLLLTLAGLNLIEFSESLFLYSGITLIVISALLYFLI
jgi:hypothetical protein